MARGMDAATSSHALDQHLARLSGLRSPSIAELLNDPDRLERFSAEAAGLRLDISKTAISATALDALLSLAWAADVEGWREKLFAGEAINTSENRAVLHPALRGVGGQGVGGGDVRAEVEAETARMDAFAREIVDGGRFKSILHIGIGGSDLGPRLAAEALAPTRRPALDLRFVANVDAWDFERATQGLEPATTLVVVVSKSFGTQETLMNARLAKQWLARRGRMVAVTTNTARAVEFGVDAGDVFGFWDWVGGRYSLWSAVGLSLRIAFGPDVVGRLLRGAAEMDRHFRDAPPARNLPVLLALAGVWNRNVEGYPTLAVVPYATPLALLPQFLQQLEMESNGKGARRDGTPAGPACPVVWGTEGTNGQHAYFQWLHQGVPGAPVDFIAVAEPYAGHPEHHQALLANCFAQSEALMRGKGADAVRAENPGADSALVAQKTFPGNRPSTTLLLDRLSPERVGALLALYEHKVFVQGVLWGVNSFDQWGVELGKVLAGAILGEMESGEVGEHDASTAALVRLTT